jgi:hypothetical protein
MTNRDDRDAGAKTALALVPAMAGALGRDADVVGRAVLHGARRKTHHASRHTASDTRGNSWVHRLLRLLRLRLHRLRLLLLR